MNDVSVFCILKHSSHPPEKKINFISLFYVLRLAPDWVHWSNLKLCQNLSRAGIFASNLIFHQEVVNSSKQTSLFFSFQKRHNLTRQKILVCVQRWMCMEPEILYNLPVEECVKINTEISSASDSGLSSIKDFIEIKIMSSWWEYVCILLFFFFTQIRENKMKIITF